MDISESVLIEASLSDAWPLLQNVGVVVACLPGARLEGPTENDGEYSGALDVAMGPTRASFSGRVRFLSDQEAHRVDIIGRGQDARGRTRAAVEVAVRAEEAPEARTRLVVGGTIDVVGALERFASTGGVHLARELMGAFAGNLAAYIEGSGAQSVQAPGETDPSSSAARPDLPRNEPLRLGALIRRFLVRLFGRKRG